MEKDGTCLSDDGGERVEAVEDRSLDVGMTTRESRITNNFVEEKVPTLYFPCK
jgi:hypothetical protein